MKIKLFLAFLTLSVSLCAQINTGGGGGGGTVTSVGLTAPSGFAVAGSPVVGAGTLAITYTSAADQILLSTGVNTAGFATLTSCSGANSALTYNTTTHAFGCNSTAPGTVTSVLGTTNQITSDGSTTTPTLSLPATLIAPGTFQSTTSSSEPIDTITGNGTASVAPLSITGTPFTGGTGTTTFPLIYENSGTAPTTWSTTGTIFGDNTPSGWAGNHLDFHNNGSTSVFSVSAGGTVTAASNVFAGGSAAIGITARSKFASSADGLMLLSNNGSTDFTRLMLGGTTSSFPSIKRNTTAINIRLADDSADAPLTASALTASTTLSVGAGGTTFDTTGLMGNYRGIGTSGLGLSPMVGNTVSASASATVGPTTLYTPGVNSSYMAIANVTCLSGTGTVTLKITYTDTSSTAQTIQPAAAACTTLGANSLAVINSPIRVKASTAIAVTATLSGTSSFDLSAQIKQLTSN